MRRCPPISIHALREEGDTISSFPLSFLRYFYPRPPRGGRRFIWLNGIKIDKFLSTPSARRATVLFPDAFRHYPISIHALREEGDLLRYWLSLSTPSARRATRTTLQAVCLLLYFYPRPPRGGRPSACCPLLKAHAISIHALREEGDSMTSARQYNSKISIHALREEGDGQT